MYLGLQVRAHQFHRIQNLTGNTDLAFTKKILLSSSWKYGYIYLLNTKLHFMSNITEAQQMYFQSLHLLRALAYLSPNQNNSNIDHLLYCDTLLWYIKEWGDHPIITGYRESTHKYHFIL